MKTIDVNIIGQTASGKSAIALLLMQQLTTLHIPVDLRGLDQQLEENPERRVSDLIADGTRVQIIETNIPIPPPAPAGVPLYDGNETPLQTFIRLFNETMGELEDHDRFDLDGNDAGSVAAHTALTAQANIAIRNLHAFLVRHPVGSISL